MSETITIKQSAPKQQRPRSRPIKIPKVKVEVRPNPRPRATPRNKRTNVTNMMQNLSMSDFRELTLRSEHMPSTEAGLDWVRAALNPCGEDPTPNLVGIPDGSGNNSALLQLRDDLIISPPAAAIAEGDTWNVVIYSTPYFASQLIMIRFINNIGPSQTSLRGAINALTTTEWDNSARYPNFFSPVNTMSDFGVITSIPVAQRTWELSVMVPAALGNFGSSTSAQGWTYFRKWRTVYKGHTVHLNAPDLANQGRIISSGLATESAIKNINHATGVDAARVVTSIACRFSVTPPYADNVIMMQDTNARQDVIKKGEYVQQRFWNPRLDWNEGEDVRPIFRVPDSSVTGALVQLTVTPLNAYLKVDGFDQNLGWVVENVRGLSSEATVHIKHRVGLSVNVDGTSPWAPFMRSPPPLDQGAINLYYELAQRLPHAYDSNFNDWGFLANIISRCIGSIGMPLLRSAIGAGGALIHNLVDKGIAKGDKMLNKYSSATGNTGYGDRGFQ